MRQLLLELLAPQSTAEQWRVPDGYQAYAIAADQPVGEAKYFFAIIDPSVPEDLAKLVFDNYPDTVWYRHEPASPRAVAQRGREVRLERAITARQEAIKHFMESFVQLRLTDKGIYGR